MAEQHKKGLDAQLIWNDLEDCCLQETNCGQCKKESCIIGFAKKCVSDYMKAPKKEVAGGASNIPIMDFKVFDEPELERAIAHILKECKDCKQDHTENCMINVIRNCYEVGLFGDIHPFEGSVFQYLMYLNSQFPEKSARIAQLYKS